jgi:hypothetical protein
MKGSGQNGLAVGGNAMSSTPYIWHKAFTAPYLETRIMKRLLLLTSILFLAAAAAQAEPVTNPITYTWIATSCETWNCAASAMIMANGDKYVITVPTGDEERPWLILRRVEEGSIFIPDDEPYACNVFETLTAASSHMSAMDTCHAPIILNVPDGRTLVTSLSNCSKSTKRRVAR